MNTIVDHIEYHEDNKSLKSATLNFPEFPDSEKQYQVTVTSTDRLTNYEFDYLITNLHKAEQLILSLKERLK